MSVSGDGGLVEVSWRRFIGGAVFSFAAPFGVGVLVALAQPDHAWHVDGLGPFLAICGGLATLAALGAYLAGAEPFAVGVMAGIPIALGSIVRDGSSFGALIAIAAGLIGGWAAWAWIPRRRSPNRGLYALIVVVVVLGTPVGVFARVTPGTAARALSADPALAVDITPSVDSLDPRGFVFTGERRSHFSRGSIVVLSGHGFGSWRAERSISVPEGCAWPEQVDSTGRQYLFDFNARVFFGISITESDFERICWSRAEGVAAGFAPRGTKSIVATTTRGTHVGVPMGVDGAYVISMLEGRPGSEFVRLSFRDAGGGLLDSKAFPGLGNYAGLVMASGLARVELSETLRDPVVMVSAYQLTPEEFRTLCGEEPPYGDEALSLGIVRRIADGATREVVIGSGTPISSHHPAPDPPLVRPSDGTPCFLKG